jgi:hypothetical protein
MPDPTQGGPVAGENRAALDRQVSCDPLEVAREQAAHGEAEGRLARAAFPDDADDGSRFDLQIDAVESTDRPVAGGIFQFEIVDVQERIHVRSRPRKGSTRSRSPSPVRFTAAMERARVRPAEITIQGAISM